MNAQRPETEKDLLEPAAAELDALAPVPDAVLAGQVRAYGRCLWEITSGDPPEWTGAEEPDRELAAQLCAGCPVRRECLELELRVAGHETVGVWGALGEDDRRDLHRVWIARRREDIDDERVGGSS